MSDDIKKVSANREKKEVLVSEISASVEKAKGMVFTNYQGLTHKQIEELKKAIKPLDADMVVAKNTLLKIALEKGNIKLDESTSLEGPTGTMFLYGDIIEPLKKLAKSIKDLNLPTIKFAVIDGKITSANDVIKLSTLPSREALLAQVVGTLKAPIFGLHRSLNWNLQKLVLTLNAVAQAKPAVAAAPATAPVAEPVSEPVAEVTDAPTAEVSEPTVEEPAIEAPAETTNEETPSENIPTEKTEEVISEGGEN